MTDENESPLQWHPHDDPRYDSILAPLCTAELESLRKGTSADRLAFICDPKDAHKRLYSALAPTTHKEYAGTYRGTTGTTLFQRESAAIRVTDGQEKRFIPSSDVKSWLNIICKIATELFSITESKSPQEKFWEAVRIFYLFGRVHPFLDGNGHLQRLMFAACIFELPDYELLPNWTIHPRPYDIEVAEAYELPDQQAVLSNLASLLLNSVRIIPTT